jgi:hypothetical protein
MNKMLLAGLTNSHPLVRIAAKYWWLAIPAGWAMWTLSKKRDRIDAAGLIQDFGTCFGPVIPLIVLGEMMADREERQKSVATPAIGLQGPVKDASFSVRPIAQPAGTTDETLAGEPAFPPQFMAGG